MHKELYNNAHNVVAMRFNGLTNQSSCKADKPAIDCQPLLIKVHSDPSDGHLLFSQKVHMS